MSGERLLLDTSFLQALVNRRDQGHSKARSLLPRVRAAAMVLVTEAVLFEFADGMSALDREGAARWIGRLYATANVTVVPSSTDHLKRALHLYSSRPDKTWSLTDCCSFLVMEDEGIQLAATADRHFVQAGFRALMLEED